MSICPLQLPGHAEQERAETYTIIEVLNMASDTYEDERRPLLPQDKKQDDTTIAHEARVLLQYAIPLAAISFLRYARRMMARPTLWLHC